MIIIHADKSCEAEVFFDTKELQGLLNTGYIRFEAKTGKLYADAVKIADLIYKISDELVFVNDTSIHDTSEEKQEEIRKIFNYQNDKCYSNYLKACLNNPETFEITNPVFRFEQGNLEDLVKVATISGINNAEVRMDSEYYYLLLDTPIAPGILYEYGTCDETNRAHLFKQTERLGNIGDIISVFN